MPSRFSAAAFAATLMTSLVVTWLSAQSTETFLREKIDEKFPAILRSVGERLELWYSQRQLEIETFARSDTVEQSVARMLGSPASRSSGVDAGEAERYLRYVLERFPQYQALFVLDERGGLLLSVGAELTLPDGLRMRMASVTDSRVGDIQHVGDRRIQAASAPVKGGDGERLGSLHALMGVASLESVLAIDELGTTGGIYIVGREGEPLMRSPGSRPRERYTRALPLADTPATVESYTNDSGEDVVGSAMRFERFGWTIIVEETYVEAFAPVVAVVRKTLAINLGIVVVFSLMAFQIARSIVRPIVALSAQARRIAAGETDVRIAVSERRDEVGVLTRAVNEMTARLHANQVELQRNRREIEEANARLTGEKQELQRVNEVLEQLSITDDLTRLHNHRYFQEHLPREIKRARRTGEPLALLLIDIDDFKKLNDRYGHAVGDAVLRKVADVMNGLVREMDLLARYGGEEFALLASQTGLKGAVALAEKIRMAVAQTRFPTSDGQWQDELSITVSIGVAPLRDDERTLFNDADGALYRAKRAGKDCVMAAEASGAAEQ